MRSPKGSTTLAKQLRPALAAGDVSVAVSCPKCDRRLVRWVGRPSVGVEGFIGAGKYDWWGAMNDVFDSENFTVSSFGSESSGRWAFTCNGSRPAAEGKGCGHGDVVEPDQARQLFQIGHRLGGTVTLSSRV
jgi:hypothetical protein